MATITSRIVGPDGEPIQYDVLDREISAASLTGVRQIWRDSVAANLGPERLARILQGAIEGDARDYLTLAEEMEEKDGHYASVLATRKLAISGLEVRVEAFSDESRDQKIAEAVREQVSAPWFRDAVFDLTDALGKGYSVCEIVWDRSGSIWKPVAMPHRDARFFQFDRETGQTLRLIDEQDMVNGIPLPPFKFIVHRPRLRTGLPIRGGLARTAAIAFMCKSWTWKDWMTFADIYGVPMRIGKYSGKPSEADIRKLQAAVSNLGTDAAAVIHESMQIEFQQAPNSAGAGDFFRSLAEYWDKQTSKVVLGQTMTADDGASLAQAKVHNEVRLDLLDADAHALSTTARRDLVRPFVDLNFGPGRYPTLVVVVPKPEDIKLLLNALDRLVPMGLEVEMSVVRDKLGLPDPPKGAVLLKAAAQTSSSDTWHRAPGPAPATSALNAEQPAAARTREDQLVQLLAGRVDPIVAQWVDRIERLVATAASLEEIRDGLLQLLPDLPADRFAQVMRQALAIAGVAGIGDAADDSRA